MKLTDAAIWDIEMGAPPSDDGVRPFADQPAYAAFGPAFARLPWLNKAQLRVVDFQNSGPTPPQWIVLEDVDEEGVFVQLRRTPASVDVFAVRRSRKDLNPGTEFDPVAWGSIGQVTDAGSLLRALNSPWGGGRHVG